MNTTSNTPTPGTVLFLSSKDVDRVVQTFTPEELVGIMARVFFEFSSTSATPMETTTVTGSMESSRVSTKEETEKVQMPHRTSIRTPWFNMLYMPARIDAFGCAIKVVSVPVPSTSAAPSPPSAVLVVEDGGIQAGELAPGGRTEGGELRKENQRGLKASTLVLDERTGEVKAVLNATKLTALRNAAGSLLSTQLLHNFPSSSGRGRPRNIVAIGAGTQIGAHLKLFIEFYHDSVVKCTIFNRGGGRLEGLVRELNEWWKEKWGRNGNGESDEEGSQPQLVIEERKMPDRSQFYRQQADVVVEAAEATGGAGFGVLGKEEGAEEAEYRSTLLNADVVITATSSTVPLFPCGYISPGTHLCLIGSYTKDMHEVDTELIERAGMVVVDSKEACKASIELPLCPANSIRIYLPSPPLAQIEAGELIKAGLPDTHMVELGRLVNLASFIKSPSLLNERQQGAYRSSLLSSALAWTPNEPLINLVRLTSMNMTERRSPSTSPSSDASESSKRWKRGDITIFKSVGLGVQDVAIASAVMERAEREGEVGTRLVW